MTEEVINKLPDIFKARISNKKKASYDNENHVYMSESQMKVILFDKIPKSYAKNTNCPNVPASNDALYMSKDDDWYFIEFKNGSVDKADLYRKIYDSLIILLELGLMPDYSCIRGTVNYILVYNSEKYGKIQASKARDMNFDYIMRLSDQEEQLFGVEKFEGYLFKTTHTYTKRLFEKNFVIPMEACETSGDLRK